MTLPAEILSNRVFDQLQIGDSASLTRTVGPDDITLFATVSGDTNPAHLNPVFAEKGIFGHVIAHGMWTAALVSAVLGTRLPGPGTIYLGQEIRFLRPVTPGDTITATVRVIEKRERDHRVTLETVCTNQNGKDVLSGLATVKAPDEPVSLPVTSLPEVTIQRPSRFQALIAEARALPPVRAGVVHPCSAAALRAAIEVRDEGLLDPLLIGPEAKIRALAEETGLSLDGIGIEPVAHSHAAAARAVELAVSGRVSMLVKGSIRSDELLGAVTAHGSGLRTDRRISHVYVMDVPAYAKLVMVTDANVNILPTLEHKRDICQNAVDLMHLLGVARPMVAALAAVETVNPQMPATIDAAALTAMAARGQISGAIVDGPLAFDNAISAEAAATKRITSPIAGQADILLVPNLEAGDMLAKQLIYFGNATAAGLVLGAGVADRADQPRRSDERADRLGGAGEAGRGTAPGRHGGGGVRCGLRS